MFFVWYDDNPKKAVIAKIDEAVLRYKQKFGKNPNVCKLNEKMQTLDESLTGADLTGVKIQGTKNIPQNYFWLGNEA